MEYYIKMYDIEEYSSDDNYDYEHSMLSNFYYQSQHYDTDPSLLLDENNTNYPDQSLLPINNNDYFIQAINKNVNTDTNCPDHDQSLLSPINININNNTMRISRWRQ